MFTRFGVVLLLFIVCQYLLIVSCIVFQNVTLNLSRYPLGSAEDNWELSKDPPRKTVTIIFDNNLRDYVINETLQDIVIWGQNIPKLLKNSIANLPNTRQIVMVQSNIKIIQPGAFKNLSNLEVIDLKMNAISEIRNGLFNNLNISYLYLNSNNISRIGSRAFNNMKLKWLRLDDNKISTWNNDWFLGTPLQKIYISSNFITELKSGSFYFAKNFNSLNDTLDFSYNNIQNIEVGAFVGISRLNYLNLENNALRNLPMMVFRGIQYLHILKLNYNHLTDLNDAWFHAMDLKYLFYQNNQVKCVAKGTLRALRTTKIFLEGNPINCDCVKRWHHWKEMSKNRTRNVFQIDNLDKFNDTCVSWY